MGTIVEENHNQKPQLLPQVSPPKIISSMEELQIPEAVVENLILKHLAAYPKSDVLQLASLLGIVTHLIEDLLADLRKKALVEVFQPTAHSIFSESAKSHVRYALSEQGQLEADTAFRKDAYIGPVPVSLKIYNEMVEAQDLRANLITRQDVEGALSDVYGAQRLVPVLGPAINSGRALLLYGHAGTGKSFVAARILNSLNTSVYVPHAVYAAGNIIKVFSEQHHKPIDTEHNREVISLKSHYDKRWVLCERPNVQVGGELTMDMLEVNHSEHNRIWIAPLQMIANNGILVIDDLGRQPMPVATLLNRWIVPMEYNYDHLSLPNGQQITIPFVLTMAFSTNLNPQKIADPAFLRRLGYKIQFQALIESDYLNLWSDLSSGKGLEVLPSALESLLSLHSLHNVGYFPCLPKDILGISQDIIQFEQIAPQVDSTILQRAWDLYFTADEQGESVL
ncbi:AAA family ATPase [Vibrio breoganii]|uniref:AAA family ATPase n=2 Tax=Vibrio breoganii TaxID=553239 RepID=UPI000C850E32|nr:AAA family ATPase [Vibrio breoganii]PMG99811.1 AAA family ATPase [Vibrio breoganii]PMH12753.1 AAA family ATPase [Vibrio breoganii]PMK52915.1 AAA family ATPase [Vibrio breoganii]PMK69343.1 AAA family ATPase [Vibrio breoganii]PMM15885.1 AAA family ATPase [Vibrio breoganii]